MAVLKPSTFLVFAVAVNFARAHVAILGGHNHLHPVQGLYVKPSTDGTTGDLYVAATEDKAHWLAENPLNFLNHYASSVPDEAVVTNQKRAIVTSPQIKYTYAMPFDGGAVPNAISSMLPYPMTIPAATTNVASAEGSENTDTAATVAATAAATAASVPYYQHPYYQLYYSQMMSAYANALNNAAAKDGSGEEGTNTATATTGPQTPAWPYSYPVQYVMVDPTAWAKAQASTAAAQTTSTTETSTAAASDESS